MSARGTLGHRGPGEEHPRTSEVVDGEGHRVRDGGDDSDGPQVGRGAGPGPGVGVGSSFVLEEGPVFVPKESVGEDTGSPSLRGPIGGRRPVEDRIKSFEGGQLYDYRRTPEGSTGCEFLKMGSRTSNPPFPVRDTRVVWTHPSHATPTPPVASVGSSSWHTPEEESHPGTVPAAHTPPRVPRRLRPRRGGDPTDRSVYGPRPSGPYRVPPGQQGATREPGLSNSTRGPQGHWEEGTLGRTSRSRSCRSYSWPRDGTSRRRSSGPETLRSSRLDPVDQSRWTRTEGLSET